MRSQFSSAVEKLFTAMLFLSLVGMLSCSSKSEKQMTADNVYSFKTATERAQAIQNFTLTCEGPCPQNAGVLIVVLTQTSEAAQFETCSFSLVGEDIILTARHCLPDDLQQASNVCSGKMDVLFVDKEGNKEVFGCKRILGTPNNAAAKSKFETDSIFLQLDRPTTRPPVRFASGGVQDKEVLTAVVATPIANDEIPGSRMQRIQCDAHMNSFYNPDYTTPFSPTVAFKNCLLLPGNSGAGMLDQTGALKAVATKSTTVSKRARSQPKTYRDHLQHVLVAGGFAEGVNAVCLESQELHLNPTERGCNPNGTPYMEDFESLFDAKNEFSILTDMQRSLNSASKTVQFKALAYESPSAAFLVSGEFRHITFEPQCLVGSANSGIPWLTPTEAKALAAGKSFKKTITINLKTIHYVAELNADARFVPRKTATESPLRLTIPLDTNSLSAGTPLQVLASAGGAPSSGKEKTMTLSLPFCE